jgi:hypothetical protein
MRLDEWLSQIERDREAPLEQWLIQLIEIAAGCLKELEQANSDAEYRRATELVNDRLEGFFRESFRGGRVN